MFAIYFFFVFNANKILKKIINYFKTARLHGPNTHQQTKYSIIYIFEPRKEKKYEIFQPAVRPNVMDFSVYAHTFITMFILIA